MRAAAARGLALGIKLDEGTVPLQPKKAGERATQVGERRSCDQADGQTGGPCRGLISDVSVGVCVATRRGESCVRANGAGYLASIGLSSHAGCA
jgi:hypothetical protein